MHYISPYRPDLNIGKAINDAVEQITAYPRDANKDWIVLTDHDTLWLLPDSKAQVERILATTEFDVLGCKTNRIRSKEQLISGFFNEDDRIREHIRIAKDAQRIGGDMVLPARGPVAAFMLCFRVSMWQAVGGFTETALNFDSLFSYEALRVRPGCVGIMQGVYVWHSYRITSKNARNDSSHLIKTT